MHMSILAYKENEKNGQKLKNELRDRKDDKDRARREIV